MTSQSVITEERFFKGKTFAQYMESGIRNYDQFKENYENLALSSKQESILKNLGNHPNRPDHMVIIGEDWCPDVYRGLPVGQKIGETLGIEVRIFERDQNMDMIGEYLKGGEFASIPVFIFYNEKHEEICHFIERPELANQEIGIIQEVLGDMSPEAIKERLGHEPSEEEIQKERTESREQYKEWQKGETWANWRIATVDEVIQLLSSALSL